MPWTSSQWQRHSLMPTTDARSFSVLFSGPTVTAGRITIDNDKVVSVERVTVVLQVGICTG